MIASRPCPPAAAGGHGGQAIRQPASSRIPRRAIRVELRTVESQNSLRNRGLLYARRALYEVLEGFCVYRYFKLGILARRATAHLAQLADQHESHQAASQAFRKVPSLGLWPVTSGLKFIFGYFLGGAANARRVVKNGFFDMFWRRVECAMVANNIFGMDLLQYQF